MKKLLRVHIESGTGLTSVTARGHHRPWVSYLATVWLLAFLTTLAVGIYGMFVQFVPATRFLELFTIPAVIVPVLLVVPMTLFAAPFFYSDQSPLRDKVKGRLMALLTAVVLPWCLSHGLLVGGPSLAHHFAPSVEMTRSYVVAGRGAAYRSVKASRGCTGRLYLKTDVLMLRATACGLPRNEWNRAKPGDEVYLTGDVSWFGIKYMQARIAVNSGTF